MTATSALLLPPFNQFAILEATEDDPIKTVLTYKNNIYLQRTRLSSYSSRRSGARIRWTTITKKAV